MIYIAIIILGMTGLSKLSVDLFPDIELPAVIILTQQPGVGPQEIETSITRLVEGAVASTEGIDRLTAVSREGISAVTVLFKWGQNLDAAMSDIRDKLDLIVNRLPNDVQKPMLFRLSSSMMPIMFLALLGDKPLPYLYDFADQKLKDQIVQTPGIANVNIDGARLREVQVVLNRNRLDAYGITPDQIIGVLAAENVNISGGIIKSKYSQYVLRTQGEFQDVDEIRNIIVSYQHGIPVYLNYVADVNWGISEETSRSRINDKSGLRMVVSRQSGSNSVEAVDLLRKKLEVMRQELPTGVELREIMSSTDFTRSSINSTVSSAVMGGILAVLVVLIFLRNIRASLIIGTAIPLSIITTFIGMFFFKVNLNMISLGGLTLGIGMLVDNAIIVLENTYNYMARGQKAGEAARLGAQEIAGAIMGSTLTTICVFLPIMFTSGMAKEIFTDMALTVTFSLVASIFVAMTLVPMLSAKYLKHYDDSQLKRLEPKLYKIISFGEHMLVALEAKYRDGIRWAIEHIKTVLLGTLAVFLFTMIIIFPAIDFEFMPQSDQGNMTATVTMPVGTRLEVTCDAGEQMTELVKEIIPKEYITNLSYMAGSSGGFQTVFGSTGGNIATVQIRLVSRTQRDKTTMEYIKIMQEKLADCPAPLGVASVNFSSGGNFMGGSAIDILVRGHDLKKGAALASQIKDIIDAMPELYNSDISRKEGAPEITIVVNRYKAASMGLNMASIGMAIQQSVLGRVATYMREEGREYDILVRLDENDRASIEDIENIQVISTFTRRPIRIGNIAEIVRDIGPINIERDDQMRVVHVTCDTFTGLQQAVDKIRREINANIIIPEGFSLDYKGSFQDMQDTFGDLVIALIVAIALIYAVMAAIFESYLDPFIICFAIPLGLIGVAWILFLTGTSLSVNGLIGVLVLAGIVVNNGIVLVDYINILRARGIPLKEAICEAGRRRLRPILMTTLTTVIALIPGAIGLGEGDEMQIPLARTVVGGLSVSTFFTLFFVPVTYLAFDNYIEKRRKKKAGRVSITHRIGNAINTLFSRKRKKRR
jgi:HAE1 family hydrophobic/amphiphilic exporter-1